LIKKSRDGVVYVPSVVFRTTMFCKLVSLVQDYVLVCCVLFIFENSSDNSSYVVMEVDVVSVCVGIVMLLLSIILETVIQDQI